MKQKILTTICLLILVGTQTGCWVTADEGTVQVQTIYGKISHIIRASDGGLWTIFTIGDNYFPVNLRAKTEEVEITASSKDNAALMMKVAVTYHVTDSDENITAYVRKFGLDDRERSDRLGQILRGQVNTETKNSLARFDAYALLANQEQIQKTIQETLARSSASSFTSNSNRCRLSADRIFSTTASNKPPRKWSPIRNSKKPRKPRSKPPESTRKRNRSKRRLTPIRHF